MQNIQISTLYRKSQSTKNRKKIMSKSKYNISESLTDSTNAHNQKDCKLADQICTTKKM